MSNTSHWWFHGPPILEDYVPLIYCKVYVIYHLEVKFQQAEFGLQLNDTIFSTSIFLLIIYLLVYFPPLS